VGSGGNIGPIEPWPPDAPDERTHLVLCGAEKSPPCAVAWRKSGAGAFYPFPRCRRPVAGARPMSNTCGAGASQLPFWGADHQKRPPSTAAAVSQSGSMRGIAILRLMATVFRAIAVWF
jgi:hypothetical protein